MKRRDFLAAAAAAPLVFVRRTTAQTQEAKLARMAIMSLTFGPILKNANSPDSPTRTLDLMDLGQMYADRFGIHNVELQHSYLPSTEDAWLKDFRARLARTKSQVSNINCEFGMMSMSADSAVNRLQAIDLTKQWINHAATLGCPRIMLNQGMLTDQNKSRSPRCGRWANGSRKASRCRWSRGAGRRRETRLRPRTDARYPGRGPQCAGRRPPAPSC